MPATTWNDVIALILQDLRVYGPQNVQSPNDTQLAKDRLNLWLDFQKTRGQAVYQNVRTVWTLVSGTATYAVGTGSTVNVQRPVSSQRISKFAYIDNSLPQAVEIDLQLPLTRAQYYAIPLKNFQAPFPSDFYYESTYPTGTIYPYPIPTLSSLQGVMYSDVVVDEVTNFAASVNLPPGFRQWILKAMRLELRDSFKVPVSLQDLALWKQDLLEVEQALFASVEVVPPDIGFGIAGQMFGGSNTKSNIYTGEE